jgi:hypothetical protein
MTEPTHQKDARSRDAFIVTHPKTFLFLAWVAINAAALLIAQGANGDVLW